MKCPTFFVILSMSVKNLPVPYPFTILIGFLVGDNLLFFKNGKKKNHRLAPAVLKTT